MMSMRKLAAALACLIATCTPAVAQDPLPILARIGPWPVLSNPIVFDGRLWFVNSVKGVNHNSADVYSYDPVTAEARYERHLFSQDSGTPVVHGDRLYWPFEDSRFSLGWGHFLATDGATWDMGTIPTARIFHTHAMAEAEDRLVAATSAWRAGIQVSTDGGRTWSMVYDHPTPEGRVTRFTDLAVLGGTVFARLVAGGQPDLVRVQAGGVTAIPGWPEGRRIVDLRAFDGRLYALVREDDGVGLWRSDGTISERLDGPEPGWAARALAVDASGIWVAGATSPDDGLLWHSPDGQAWTKAAALPHGLPWQIAIMEGQPFVVGAGDDGRGILWGPASAAPPVRAPRRAAGWTFGAVSEVLPDALGARLDRALADPKSYDSRRTLRDLVYAAAEAGAPGRFFAGRLGYSAPDLTVSLIGGAVRVPARDLGRWILLWGIAQSRGGRVPLDLLAADWTAPQNPSEKYFDAPPSAMWAAAAIGQRDRATIDTLIARLGRDGEPLWLRGDAVGALTALTDRRFGYDVGAWRAWWESVKDSWPK